MKSYAFTDKYETNLRNTNTSKRREKNSRNQSRNSEMSTKTIDFIQKICYRKTASVDMTKNGFISDSKLHPVNLLLKPLRTQLEKICIKTHSRTPSARTPRQFNSSPCSSARQYGSVTTASISPDSRLPRRPVRKVQIQSPSSLIPSAKIKKNVRLVLPTTFKKK